MVKKTLILLLFLSYPVFSQTKFDSKLSTKTVISNICDVTVSSWVIKTRWDTDNIYIYTQEKYKGIITTIDKTKYDYDLLFTVKPTTNVFRFNVDGAENYEFYYQPPLTQSEKDNGDIRPDNVVGSYAVYHKTKKDNQYETGKVFHIYRPKLIDKNLNSTWCTMYYEHGILTIIGDNKWLGNAVYPVILDPTFGQTSVGTTQTGYSVATTFLAKNGTLITQNGTCTYIRAACYADSVSAVLKLGLYSQTGDSVISTTTAVINGYPGNYVANSYTGILTTTQTVAPTQLSEWTGAPITASLMSQTTYWMCWVCTTAKVRMCLDIITPAIDCIRKEGFTNAYVDFPQAVAPDTWTGTQAVRWSIYVSYDLAASATLNPKWRAPQIILTE